MSEDEDVVFEGHELHRYLSEHGYTDFEVINCSVTGNKKPEISKQQLWCSFKKTLQSLQPTWRLLKKDALMSLQLEVEFILQSRLLLEEDCHFLECLSLPLDLVSGRSLWNEISLVCGLCVCGSMYLWKRKVIPGLFPIIYSLLTMEHFASKWYFSLQKSRISDAVKSLLSCCKDLYLLQKKSLKFVQENELLYRGFTLAKATSSALPLENATLPCLTKRWYVMSGLRTSIAQSALEAVRVLQLGTQSLIVNCPLSGQLDNRNNYVAFCSLEELGIQINVPDDVEYSLGNLKKFHEIYLHLQSEFLRRLALCFLMTLWKNPAQKITEVVTVINKLSADFDRCIITLNDDYKFFSCYGLKMECNCSHLRAPKTNTWTYYGPYVGTHSALLHLQGMLQRTKEVEEMLVNEIDRCEEMDSDALKYYIANITNVLTDIATEIDSCKSCIEVAINQLTVLNQKVTPAEAIQSLEVPVYENNENASGTRKPIPVGFTDLDPQLEDEIFEAIFSHDNVGADFDGDDTETSVVEKEKRQIEKEYSERVLSELKSVLVFKAQEWEQREAKALKKFVGDIKKLEDENKSPVESVSHIDHDEDSGQGEDIEIPELIDVDSDAADRYNRKMVSCVPKSDNTVDDKYDSFSVKPDVNWPLPRLKTGKLLNSRKLSCKAESVSESESSKDFPEPLTQIRTLMVGASPFRRPNCDIEEETFSGSGPEKRKFRMCPLTDF
ncbi:vezatin [Periplaneta americana]|uniref:vezatin n=1 Tax=Periplaneta americana TaxID=6978 RepID=UPI0037E820E6